MREQIDKQKQYQKKYYQIHKTERNKRSIAWAKAHPERMKEINKRTHIRNYPKNRIKLIEYAKKYAKANNYMYEKTPEQRKIRYIKRQTRRKYPLINQKCHFCSDDASEHHHTTKPITVNDFVFVCHECHNLAHQQEKCKEVSHNGKL